MKRLIIICLLLTGCQSYTYQTYKGTNLICTQEDNKAVCEITEEYDTHTKYRFGIMPEPVAKATFLGPIAKIIVVELAKSLTVEMIKEVILREYIKHHGITGPTQVTLLKSH